MGACHSAAGDRAEDRQMSASRKVSSDGEIRTYPQGGKTSVCVCCFYPPLGTLLDPFCTCCLVAALVDTHDGSCGCYFVGGGWLVVVAVGVGRHHVRGLGDSMNILAKQSIHATNQNQRKAQKGANRIVSYPPDESNNTSTHP
jgi:hypothetical protein